MIYFFFVCIFSTLIFTSFSARSPPSFVARVLFPFSSFLSSASSAEMRRFVSFWRENNERKSHFLTEISYYVVNYVHLGVLTRAFFFVVFPLRTPSESSLNSKRKRVYFFGRRRVVRSGEVFREFKSLCT